MASITAAYSNLYTGPSSVTSAPTNFAPGQVQSTNDNDKDDTRGGNVTSAADNDIKKNTGFVTESRGNNLNIVV